MTDSSNSSIAEIEESLQQFFINLEQKIPEKSQDLFSEEYLDSFQAITFIEYVEETFSVSIAFDEHGNNWFRTLQGIAEKIYDLRNKV